MKDSFFLVPRILITIKKVFPEFKVEAHKRYKICNCGQPCKLKCEDNIFTIFIIPTSG